MKPLPAHPRSWPWRFMLFATLLLIGLALWEWALFYRSRVELYHVVFAVDLSQTGFAAMEDKRVILGVEGNPAYPFRIHESNEIFYLTDTGEGGDLRANDGVYSKRFEIFAHPSFGLHYEFFVVTPFAVETTNRSYPFQASMQPLANWFTHRYTLKPKSLGPSQWNYIEQKWGAF